MTASGGGATPGHIGAGLFRREQRFFEPQSFAPQKQPDRIVRDLHAARGQFAFQPVQDQLRRPTDPFLDEGAMRFQCPLAGPTHLAGRNRDGRAIALRPLHRRRHRNPKARRNRPAALAADNRPDSRSRRSLERGRVIRCWPPIQPASRITNDLSGESLSIQSIGELL